MTIALSWGRYGGFYRASVGKCRRICLGCLALTLVPVEVDELMRAWAQEGELQRYVDERRRS